MPKPAASGLDSDLTEILETRVRILLSHILDQYPVDRLEAELASLIELITDFGNRDALLEKLSGITTTGPEARSLVDQLPERDRLVAQHQSELKRLYDNSHQVVQQSALLLARAQRLVDQSRNPNSSYALEICGHCSGIGGSQKAPCLACKGRRTILVLQPAVKCSLCEGNGKTGPSDAAIQPHSLCVPCNGSGWAFALADGESRTRSPIARESTDCRGS
jgi:hypothetical protein